MGRLRCLERNSRNRLLNKFPERAMFAETCGAIGGAQNFLADGRQKFPVVGILHSQTAGLMASNHLNLDPGASKSAVPKR